MNFEPIRKEVRFWRVVGGRETRPTKTKILSFHLAVQIANQTGGSVESFYDVPDRYRVSRIRYGFSPTEDEVAFTNFEDAWDYVSYLVGVYDLEESRVAPSRIDESDVVGKWSKDGEVSVLFYGD